MPLETLELQKKLLATNVKVEEQRAGAERIGLLPLPVGSNPK